MPEFITLEEAARITGFPSQEIQQWAISKKITSYVVKQGVRLVDLTNLREFISISSVWEYKSYTCNLSSKTRKKR